MTHEPALMRHPHYPAGASCAAVSRAAEPRDPAQSELRATLSVPDLEEATAHAAEKVADLPDGDAKELLRLSHECGYLGRALMTRNMQLRTLRERIREMDAREIERLERTEP